MTIQSEINRIKGNIATAYTQCEEKGATLPDTQNSQNLADTIASIPSGSGGGDLVYATNSSSYSMSKGNKVLLKKMKQLEETVEDELTNRNPGFCFIKDGYYYASNPNNVFKYDGKLHKIANLNSAFNSYYGQIKFMDNRIWLRYTAGDNNPDYFFNNGYWTQVESATGFIYISNGYFLRAKEIYKDGVKVFEQNSGSLTNGFYDVLTNKVIAYTGYGNLYIIDMNDGTIEKSWSNNNKLSYYSYFTGADNGDYVITPNSLKDFQSVNNYNAQTTIYKITPTGLEVADNLPPTLQNALSGYCCSMYNNDTKILTCGTPTGLYAYKFNNDTKTFIDLNVSFDISNIAGDVSHGVMFYMSEDGLSGITLTYPYKITLLKLNPNINEWKAYKLNEAFTPTSYTGIITGNVEDGKHEVATVLNDFDKNFSLEPVGGEGVVYTLKWGNKMFPETLQLGLSQGSDTTRNGGANRTIAPSILEVQSTDTTTGVDYTLTTENLSAKAQELNGGTGNYVSFASLGASIVKHLAWNIDEDTRLVINTESSIADYNYFDEDALGSYGNNANYTYQKTIKYIVKTIAYADLHRKVGEFGQIDPIETYAIVNKGGREIKYFHDHTKEAYTIVGSPTITDGVLSNITASNYVKLSSNTPETVSSYEVLTKFTTGSSVSSNYYIFCESGSYYATYIGNGKIRIYDGSDRVFNNLVVEANKTYWLRRKTSGNTTTIYLLEDDGYTRANLPPLSEWQKDTVTGNSITYLQNKTISFGASTYFTGNPFTGGSIYLNDTFIYINEELWW